MDFLYNFRIHLHIFPCNEKGCLHAPLLQPFQKLFRVIRVGAIIC